MDRYILVFKRDDESVDQVFSWVKGLMPEVDDPSSDKAEEKRLLKWIPVTPGFDQVCSPSTLCQWVDIDTLAEGMKDKASFLSDENVTKQELETCLNDTADSIPCIGCSVQMYIFLRADDLGAENSFIPLAGAAMRFTKWLHVRMFIVKMDNELPAFGHQLADLTSGQVVSLLEGPQPMLPSWAGEVSVTDEVSKDGIVFPGFYISFSKWDEILKQVHRPLTPEKVVRRARGRKDQVDTLQQQDSHIVCSHSMEVLQEVDLTTFPLYLLTPWYFYLHRFSDSGTGKDLVEYFHDKKRTGLIARLRVYRMNGDVPLCGDTSHLSTWAWRDYVIGEPSQGHINKHVSSPYEYLHLLIMPNPVLTRPSLSSSPSSGRHCFRIRVLSTTTDLARNIFSVAKKSSKNDSLGSGRKSRKPSESSSERNRKTDNDEEQGEDQDWIKSLPVIKVEDFFTTLQAIDQYENKAREPPIDGHAPVLEAILKKMRTSGHTLGDELKTIGDAQEWKSEAAYGLSKCPEWKALMADVPGGHSLNVDISSVDSGSSSTASLSRQKSFEKTGHKEFSIDLIIHLFKEDKNAPLEAKLDMNPFRRQSSDSVTETTKDNKSWEKHDMYHYYTEEDFDSESRYARIRDQGGFQDTLSSFVTPKKKATKPFRAIMPTRSSPRTKLFARKLSLGYSPPKLAATAESSKSTFKHPQSLRNSSSSSHRKRPHSSLTPDTSYPLSSQRSNSSSISTSQGRKCPTSSLTPEFDQQKSSYSNHRRNLKSDSGMSQSAHGNTSSLQRKRSASFTPETEPSRPFKFARTSTPSLSPLQTSSSHKSGLQHVGETSPISSKHSSSSPYKRVPFTTVLDMPESEVRNSPRKLPNSESPFAKAVKSSKLAESSHRGDDGGPSNVDPKQNTKPATGKKMKRSERHMMRLKSIIARVLAEKGVGKDDPIYTACSKNLLNVSIVLLKSLPNSLNLTDEMKSVVYGQVQQIINLEKRRSGIAL